MRQAVSLADKPAGAGSSAAGDQPDIIGALRRHLALFAISEGKSPVFIGIVKIAGAVEVILALPLLPQARALLLLDLHFHIALLSKKSDRLKTLRRGAVA